MVIDQLIQAWGGSVDRGFSSGCLALPGVSELGTLPAALGCHDAFPGLPWRPLAAFLFDGDGVLLLADCAMMNLANLSSFEFILLCASCKMETCSVNCMIIDIWDVTV